LRDERRVENACHDKVHVVGDVVCSVDGRALAEHVGFLLRELTISFFLFLRPYPELLHEAWEVHEVKERWLKGQKHNQNRRIIHKIASIIPVLRIVPVDEHDDEGGVQETGDGQLESDGDIQLRLSLMPLHVGESAHDALEEIVHSGHGEGCHRRVELGNALLLEVLSSFCLILVYLLSSLDGGNHRDCEEDYECGEEVGDRASANSST